MTFELYDEWVKAARWVQALGWKSLTGLKKPPVNHLHPSWHLEQGCSVSLGEIQTQSLRACLPSLPSKAGHLHLQGYGLHGAANIALPPCPLCSAVPQGKAELSAPPSLLQPKEH